MSRGPKGEKRPVDTNAVAVMVAKIAMGDLADVTTNDGKNAAAVALGSMGGKARATALTRRKRAEIARKGAATRWENEKFDRYRPLNARRPHRLIRRSARRLLSPKQIADSDEQA